MPLERGVDLDPTPIEGSDDFVPLRCGLLDEEE